MLLMNSGKMAVSQMYVVCMQLVQIIMVDQTASALKDSRYEYLWCVCTCTDYNGRPDCKCPQGFQV